MFFYDRLNPDKVGGVFNALVIREMYFEKIQKFDNYFIAAKRS